MYYWEVTQHKSENDPCNIISGLFNLSIGELFLDLVISGSFEFVASPIESG